MKTRTLSAALSAAGFLFSCAAAAADIDVLPFLNLNQGHWAITRSVYSGSLSAHVVSEGPAGEIILSWYFRDGSRWVFDSSDIFRVTDRAILRLGVDDGTDRWLFEPPFSIPRPVTINRAVVYQGIARNQRTNATFRQAAVFMVTRTGFRVDAPVGSFTGCIKTRNYHYEPGTSRDDVSLLCRDRAGVKSWYTKIMDTANPQQQKQYLSGPHVMIQHGTLNSPVP